MSTYLPGSLPNLHFTNEVEKRSGGMYLPCYSRLSTLKIGESEEMSEDFDLTLLEESRAKLKSSSSTSHLLCGFAMVCAAELQSNDPADSSLPNEFWIAYVVCTVLLVCVHAFSIMISTFVMPQLDVTVQLKTETKSSQKLRGFVEMSWVISNLLGLFLFLIELLLLLWIKFWDFFIMASIAGTIVLLPVIFIFIYFAAHSYNSHVREKFQSSMNDVKHLENLKKELDNLHYL